MICFVFRKTNWANETYKSENQHSSTERLELGKEFYTS